MHEFISQAASRFGVSEDQIRSLTGGLLKKVKAEGDDDDFAALAGQVPGLEETVAAAPDDGGAPAAGGGLLGGGGGMLGGLLGKASDAIGGGGAMDVMGLIKKSGLDVGQAGGFAQSLFGFLEEKAGAGLVDRLLSRVPALKSLLG